MAHLLVSYPVEGGLPTAKTWEFDTVDNCTTVTLNITSPDMQVDWGDGLGPQAATGTAGITSYTYSTPGKYHITAYFFVDAATFGTGYLSTWANIAKIYALPYWGMVTVQNFFNFALALEEVAEDLFHNNPQVLDFAHTFAGCTSLKSVPSGLFAKNVNATDFNMTFMDCTSLTDVPSDLFANNTEVKDFGGTFYNVPLAANTVCIDGATQYFSLDIASDVVASFNYSTYTFWTPTAASVDAVYLNVTEGSTTETTANSYNTSYPDYALTLNTTPCPVTWEFDTVEDCTSIGVPIRESNVYTGMIINWGDGNITTVSSGDDYVHTYETAGQYHVIVAYDDWDNVQLYGCPQNSLCFTAEGYELFTLGVAHIGKLPHISNTCLGQLCLGATGLVSIEEGLFDNNPQLTDINGCFAISGLKTIPSGLFDKLTELEYVSGMYDGIFAACSNLTELPAGLFANNTKVTAFTNMFSGCSGLTSIPSDLFANNTAVTTFYGAFYGCSGLTSIPSDLFANNTAVTSFQQTFCNCTGLTSIPSGLFDNNTQVTDFASIFQGCFGLTSIPSDLFVNNTAVTQFTGCFRDCTNLAGQDVRIGSEIAAYVNYFMYNTGSGNTVYVPEGSTTETAFNSATEIGCTVATY